jgi:phospholipase/carboxylesterase
MAASHTAGQLETRPHPQVRQGETGDVIVGGVVAYIPSGHDAERPLGLLVMLHGAGGVPDHAMAYVRAAADRRSFAILAPKSADMSWDVTCGGFGPDVAQIDQALAAAFDAHSIDPARVAIGGFSDGASYALSLGLANGDVFRSILAFSPGFNAAPRRSGTPRVFIAHGHHDTVLSIEHTSRRLVPRLRQDGILVEFVEFDGPHTVPPPIVTRALAWWLDERDGT